MTAERGVEVADKRTEIRVLALASAGMQAQILRQLKPLGITIDFICGLADLSHMALSQGLYRVAIVPAALPGNGWWALWGELALLNPRPEILVYARTANFQLWSGVLEAGGYDVLVEPFTDAELQQAVLRAAKSSEQRRQEDTKDE